MSGATGAGSASSGARSNDARGPATDSQGVTVTDTRGQQPSYEKYGAEQPQQGAQPYHPPQAYPSPQSAGAKSGPGQSRSQAQIHGQSQGQQGLVQGQKGTPVTSAASTAGPGTAAGPAPAAAQPPAEGQGTLAGQAGASAVRRPRTNARTTPRTRKARLRVAKADPWSVMKVSFLLSIALGVCTVVASAVLWMVMDAMGVFSTVGGTISEATGSNESNGFDLQSFLSLPRVLVFTSVIAVIDVVLATALATLGAFIYNLSAGFVGGVELTLAEDE